MSSLHAQMGIKVVTDRDREIIYLENEIEHCLWRLNSESCMLPTRVKAGNRALELRRKLSDLLCEVD